MKKRKKLTPREKRINKKIREICAEGNNCLSGTDIKNILRKVK